MLAKKLSIIKSIVMVAEFRSVAACLNLIKHDPMLAAA
jgi:hypothetical protein